MNLRQFMRHKMSPEEAFNLLPPNKYHRDYVTFNLFFIFYRQIAMGINYISMSLLGYRLLSKHPEAYIGVRYPQLTRLVSRAINQGLPIKAPMQTEDGSAEIDLAPLAHELEYIALELREKERAVQVEEASERKHFKENQPTVVAPLSFPDYLKQEALRKEKERSEQCKHSNESYLNESRHSGIATPVIQAEEKKHTYANEFVHLDGSYLSLVAQMWDD
jgi:hypothetical protein